MEISYIIGEICGTMQLFGAGAIGKEVAYMLDREGVQVKCIMDNDASKHGSHIWDKFPCVSPDDADKEIPVIPCFEKKDIDDKVRKQCLEMGFKQVLALDLDAFRNDMDTLSDREYLKVCYYGLVGKIPDLENPKTLNEKLQWIKLHNRKPLLIELGDKYRARDYIRRKFGEKYLIPLLYVTYDPESISEETLPKESYALKSNCSCGDVEIIRAGQKVDYAALREKFKRVCSLDYSRYAREWWYGQMRPCVIAEKLLLTKEGKLPNDYKLNFMNGKLQFIYCSIDREGLNYRKVYSPEWEELPFLWDGKRSPDSSLPNIDPPPTLDLMIEMGHKIAEELDYVRVDYYDVDGQLYFGEITICHGAGFDKFSPEEYDEICGKMLELPVKKGENIENYLEKFSPYHTPTYNIWDEPEEDRSEFLKLDWNESTVLPSPKVQDRIGKLVEKHDFYNLYPNTNNTILQRSIADYVCVGEENVLAFPSSDVAHENIAKVWVRKNDKCGVIWPSYDNFRATMELADAQIEYFMMPELSFDESLLREYIQKETPKLVYLCNPNNPTGELVDKEIIKSLLDDFQDILWIIDEAYGEFSGVSVCDLIEEYANLIVTRTFSKAFGLANFRIGYLVSAADNIRLLKYTRNPKNISTIAQEAVIAALDDVEWMRDYIEQVREARRFLIESIRELPFVKRVFDGKGNFVMVELQNGYIKRNLIEYLKNNHILVRDIAQTPALKERYVRITIGTMEQMNKVVYVMNNYVPER